MLLEQENIETRKDDIADIDSNRQYKKKEPQEDERDAAGLFYFPWGHERNCHHWSCPVLDKAPELQTEMKKKKKQWQAKTQADTHMHVYRHKKPAMFNWLKGSWMLGCLNR